MGIFSQADNKSSSKSNNATIISDGTFIKGGIDTTGSIFCDGKFEGAILAAESLTIGKTGEVIGQIKVSSLIVSGLIDGIINADEVTILETGKILGTMQYQNLIIEKNGIFEGQGNMKNSTLTSKYKGFEESKYKELIADISHKNEESQS